MTKTWEEMQRMDLPSDFPIDDRVNPYLIQQAIFCEIVRIRARGIEEYIRKLSFEWRTPPTFYYEVQLHDTEHTSRAFSTWDTEFIRQEVFRRVDDGLETADVTIKIFEERSIGLLGLRSEFVEVERISLRYCFRTGRWTGENYFGYMGGGGELLPHVRGVIDMAEGVISEFYKNNFAEERRGNLSIPNNWGWLRWWTLGMVSTSR